MAFIEVEEQLKTSTDEIQARKRFVNTDYIIEVIDAHEARGSFIEIACGGFDTNHELLETFDTYEELKKKISEVA